MYLLAKLAVRVTSLSMSARLVRLNPLLPSSMSAPSVASTLASSALYSPGTLSTLLMIVKHNSSEQK
jgi:hypothetical protein